MSKISNTGPRPTGSPEPTENIQKTNTAKETAEAAAPDSESASAKHITGDKYAAGDLKALGNQVKKQLDSELQNKKLEIKHTGLSPEQLAAELAKGQVRFAPPYVPVGPVVMGDNVPAPSAGEITQLNLKPDQFQINDKGNLVITNEKLIEFFKSVKESGQEILLGITKMKTPGEE
jgi:hypothetical protein